MKSENNKRQHGVYYTTGNPFSLPAFAEWAERADLSEKTVLEPFAGSNSLIDSLSELGMLSDFRSYDLNPGAPSVTARDTLTDFPTGYDVCVTNPPWLARNIATAMRLEFPAPDEYADLYLFALELCLRNCGHVAAIIPESYVSVRNLRHVPDRMCAFVSFSQKMFSDTDHPAGMALFLPESQQDFKLWRDDVEIGWFKSELMPMQPPASDRVKVRFNIPDGNAGLFGIDNTREASIRFCEADEMAGRRIYEGTKFNTVMQVDGEVRIDEWNRYLNEFRERTNDVFLTSFKGIRKDGRYRKRLPFELARRIINAVDMKLSGDSNDGIHPMLVRK